MEIAGFLIAALYLLAGWGSYTPMPSAAAPSAYIESADAEPERTVNEALSPNCGRQGTPRCIVAAPEPL